MIAIPPIHKSAFYGVPVSIYFFKDTPRIHQFATTIHFFHFQSIKLYNVHIFHFKNNLQITQF